MMKQTVQIGSVPIVAHRGQLRLSKERNDYQKPIIRWSLRQRQPASRAESEEFRGFSESEMRGRKRKHANAHAVENSTNEEVLPESTPRRSKRLRKMIVDKDFVYSNIDHHLKD
ncbi:uncharacterized protein LOC134210708 [Armigeres subalbatus]|uniref:uncharacterized protein LOC134210708 n=1 Tax=Armigeres subalbatus TaxID=124917 RepID=UPI002ED04DBD